MGTKKAELIASNKRRYRQILRDLVLTAEGELAHLDDEIFTPSTAIEMGAFQLIQQSNRLKALLEIEQPCQDDQNEG